MDRKIDTGLPQEASVALRAGKTVAVPTETVVGLVATDARRLNEAKSSDPGKPLTLLCASAEEAFSLAERVPPLARTLAGLFWPGPLTLVLDRTGGGTVGVRVPGGKVTEVLAAFGGPVYATSANLSGEPAPKSLEDVDPRVLQDVDLIVEGEPGDGEPSAVVDLSGGRARLLRPTGKLTAEDLARLSGEDLGDTGSESGADDLVEVVPYDRAWPSLFEEERARIERAIGPFVEEIEHIGSTAVPGLAAKPVVDIMVGVRSLEDSSVLVESLVALGYEYVPELERRMPSRRYFRKLRQGRRTHQVHLVERSDAVFWDRHVLFRDHLRAHPEDAEEYARLKRGLSERFEGDRDAYTDAKTDFISGIVRRAEEDEYA